MLSSQSGGNPEFGSLSGRTQRESGRLTPILESEPLSIVWREPPDCTLIPVFPSEAQF
jgi:hypothetical protein